MTTNKRTDPVDDTGFALFETAIGPCAIAWRDDAIVGTALPEPSETALRGRMAARFREANERGPSDFVADIIGRIVRLMQGERVAFDDVPLDFGQAESLERQVYAATLLIPCGDVRTYGEIAASLGTPGAARAVGVALGRNPVPIIVPCHRVLAAAGRSGGFTAPGGVATKFKLLEIERARRADDPTLFDDLPLAVKPL